MRFGGIRFATPPPRRDRRTLLDVEYRHTQVSRRPVVVVVALLILAAVLTMESLGPVLLIGSLVAIPMLFVFTWLTVVVGAEEVSAAFGRGWPRRAIRHAEIVSVASVRNTWWHGWGIRYISGGSMYNVAGLDAVELVLESGKKFRIGTDQPDELRSAINVRLGIG